MMQYNDTKALRQKAFLRFISLNLGAFESLCLIIFTITLKLQTSRTKIALSLTLPNCAKALINFLFLEYQLRIFLKP